MKILIYANCQQLSIKYFLSLYYKNIEFVDIANYQFILDDTWNIDNIKFKDIDVVLYQPVSAKFGYKSTDPSVENNLLTRFSDNCVKISFPYIYNSVIWIIIPPAFGDGAVGGWGNTEKYVNCEPILKLKHQGYNLNQVLDMYSKGNIDFEIPKRVEQYYKMLQEKDDVCDVKIIDFIKENIRKYKLFFTQNHPTSYITAHCSNQIFKILESSFKVDIFSHALNVTKISSNSYPHSLYDKEYWKFEYNSTYSSEQYIPHIKNIYKLYN